MRAALTLWCVLVLKTHLSSAFLNSGIYQLVSPHKTASCSDFFWSHRRDVMRKGVKTTSIVMIASSPAPPKLQSGQLSKALKKISGALTVAVHYVSEKNLTDSAIRVLSFELRKQKAAAVFAETGVASFSAEQSSAKGNFPGPVPVVSCSATPTNDEVDLAILHGSSGIVLKPCSSAEDWSTDVASVGKARQVADYATGKGLEVVWEVHSTAQIDAALEAGAGILLVDFCGRGPADEAVAIRIRIPRDRVAIARIQAMQPANREADDAAALRAAGFDAVLLAGACVGDAEDAEYAGWAVQALTSKVSKEFRISGMTGSVNGHYGTGTFERSTAEREWRRRGAFDWTPASTNVAGRKMARGP